MKSGMEMLREWDRATDSPSDQFIPDPALTRLRMRLIAEEHEETREELTKLIHKPPRSSRADLAKELADLLYVVYGTGSALGLDLDEALRRVHESNMSKLVNGKVQKDAGGKVLKGPNYQPPDLSDFDAIEGSLEDAQSDL